MAKGAQAKQEITNKILEVFDGSFINDKEIRIPYTENGEPLQIKLTLTAAKVMVDNPNESSDYSNPTEFPVKTPEGETKLEPTEEEKERLKVLLAKMGMA